jgi:hypothetical protein
MVLNSFVSGLRKASNGGDRRRYYGELSRLRQELREREGRAVKEILKQCNVVLATTTGCADRNLHGASIFILSVAIDTLISLAHPYY